MRREAEERGGKAWTGRQLDLLADEYRSAGLPDRLRVIGRKAGEVVNHSTGEIETGCLTISALAKELEVTSHGLTQLMAELGMVCLVLAWKWVPCIVCSAVRKPEYFHTPAVAATALEDGYVIPITGKWGQHGDGGAERTVSLITAAGQRRLRLALPPQKKAKSAPDRRRSAIAALVAEGKSPGEIMVLTGIPRRTVYRLLEEARLAG